LLRSNPAQKRLLWSAAVWWVTSPLNPPVGGRRPQTPFPYGAAALRFRNHPPPPPLHAK